MIEAELVDARDALVAARNTGDGTVQPELAAEWQGRIRRLLDTNPTLAAELRHLLDQDLTPALAATGQVWHGNVRMSGTASGHGQVNQVGQGNITITQR